MGGFRENDPGERKEDRGYDFSRGMHILFCVMQKQKTLRRKRIA